MWDRCNNPKNKDYENYKDCPIDERYRLLSNYVNDIQLLEDFDKFKENPSLYHIDKDRKDPNNRCYFFEHLSIVTIEDNLKECHERNRIDYLWTDDAILKSSENRKKPVIGISIIDGSFIILQDYADMKRNHFNPGYIRECLNGKRDSYNDYRWFYLIRK